MTVAPGDTTATAKMSVPVVGDSTPESDETVFVTADEAGAGDTAVQGTLTIEDDDEAPADPIVSVHPVAMFEGPSGTIRDLVFHVTLSRPAPRAMSVNWQTVQGSAIAGTDFNAANGTLSLAQGETHRTVRVGVRGNGGRNLTRGSPCSSRHRPTGWLWASPSADGTILDDDRGLRVAFGNCLVVEGWRGRPGTAPCP